MIFIRKNNKKQTLINHQKTIKTIINGEIEKAVIILPTFSQQNLKWKNLKN
jgi:hypothetical protein